MHRLSGRYHTLFSSAPARKRSLAAVLVCVVAALALGSASRGAEATRASALRAHCVVPGVTGRTLAAAKKRIRRAHCKVGKIRYRTSMARKKNHVLAQKPGRGRKLKKGARVHLVVGRGPAKLPPPPPPPPPARPASVFLSPSGSDGRPCTKAAPCRSFARAYQVAQLGQVVELAGGSYGDQTMSGSAKGNGAAIVFRPAAGAKATTGSVTLNGQNHIEFQNIAMSDWYIRYAKDVTFRNVTTRFFFVRSSDSVNILGGSVGPNQDATSPTIGNYAGQAVSTNVIVDGVYFHDIGRQNDPGGHVECLFLQESSGVVIRNSKFTRCDIIDLYVSPVQGGPTASNVLVENNWFDEPTDGGSYAIDIHPDNGTVPHNFTLRYNSIDSSVLIYTGFTYENMVVDSNIGRISSCDTPGVTYRYNVWGNEKCGATDRTGAPGFVNPDGSTFDLHLKPGSAAIDAGNPGSYPARDIDGTARPRGGHPDAGASER